MITTRQKRLTGMLVTCAVLALGGAGAAQGERNEPPPAADKKPETQSAADRKAGPLQRVKSLNNLKQIMLAVYGYHDTHNHLPSDIYHKNGKPLLSWRVAILPYLDHKELYDQFKLDEPWDSEHNKKLLAKMPAVFRVDFEPKNATETYYQVFAGPGTAFGPFPAAGPPLGGTPGFGPARPGRFTLINIMDGTANTLAMVEAGPPVPWTKPADIPYAHNKPLPKLAGPFNNVLNVAMFDGRAFAFRRNLEPETLRRLIEIADGKSLPDFSTLRGHFTAESAEEKEVLRKQLEENQVLLREIVWHLREQTDLIARLDSRIDDVESAFERKKELEDWLNSLKAANRRLREELKKPRSPQSPGK